jgi:hypothetical protein
VALIGANEKASTFSPLPSDGHHLSIPRCEVCHRTVAYRAGTSSEA